MELAVQSPAARACGSARATAATPPPPLSTASTSISRKRSADDLDDRRRRRPSSRAKWQAFLAANVGPIQHLRRTVLSRDAMFSSDFAVGEGKAKPRWMMEPEVPRPRSTSSSMSDDQPHFSATLMEYDDDEKDVFTPGAGASAGLRNDDPRMLRDVLDVTNYFDGFCAPADPRWKAFVGAG